MRRSLRGGKCYPGAMISTSDMEKGLWIELDGDPWQILSVTRQTPTARGAALIVKAKVRNARTGAVQEKSFRGGDKVAAPNVEEKEVEYLYADGEGRHFMDQTTYEQYCLSEEDLGDARHYLTDNLSLQLVMLDGEVLGVKLPAAVDLEITECAPPSKATGSGQTKAATLETGLVVQVPLYLERGERVRVDTREGRYLQRVKEG
ncbi:MAG: elongation factor P [Planctomycetota bacterium]|nr:MAG: elongation factor P [Planctomycetota bacterium]